MKLDPEHGPTLIRAGEMAMALGQNEKAYAWAQRALTLDSGLAGAWALRGRINRGRRQLEIALADLQHALQRAPGDREILLDLAELQMQMGRPQRSLTALHQLLDSFPPGEQPQRALWLEGLAYTAVNRPADAVASLQAASQQGPAHPDLLYQLAKAEELAGRPAAAYRAAQRALAVDSGHQPSQLLLAQLETAGSPPLRR